jgi:hypothetical protein
MEIMKNNLAISRKKTWQNDEMLAASQRQARHKEVITTRQSIRNMGTYLLK